MRPVVAGSTSVILPVLRFRDSTTFLPVASVVAATAGLVIKYWRFGGTLAAAQTITPSDLAALTTAYTSSGMIHIVDGYYRVDAPDAAYATGTGIKGFLLSATATGMVVDGCFVPLVAYNPDTASNLGLTNLDAVLTTTVTASTNTLTTNISAVETDTVDIQGRLPAALTGAGNMKSDALALNGDTTSASNLQKSTIAMLQGTAVTGTLTTAAMTTDLTVSVNDRLIGRRLIFTAAPLAYESTIIGDYDGTTKLITFLAGTTLTVAPANGQTFIIV